MNYLQGMVVQPRSGNTRVPKVDESQRSVGTDGKLYKLVEEPDIHKYRVLSEEELLLEAHKSEEMAATITSGRKATTKAYSPRLGTTNKATRIEQKKWQKTVAADKENTRRLNQSADSITSTNFVESSSSSPPPKRVSDAAAASAAATAQANTAQATTAPVGAPDGLMKAMTLLQTKYEKNLEVIELLFQEKRNMEQRVAEMEQRLRDNDTKFGTAVGTLGPEDVEKAVYPPKASQLSAAMAAALFSGDQSAAGGDADAAGVVRSSAGSNRSIPPRPSSASGTRGRSMHQSTSSSTSSPRRPSRSQTSPHVRSHSTDSAMRRSTGSFSQSLQMQASIDRYIQKKKLIDEKEDKAKLEQKQYEQMLRERNLRAARKGTEFKDMAVRCEQSERKKAEKLEAERKAKFDKELAEKEERHRLMQERINKPIIKHEMTWKEVEEQEDLRRKERAERFKQELLMSVSAKGVKAAASGEAHKEKLLRLQKEEEEKDKKARRFIAADPQKVAARLEQTRRQNELLQERKAAKRQQQIENRKMLAQSANNIPVVRSMEERDRQYAEKQAQRKKAQEAKLAEIERKKKEEERRKMKAVLNAKVPEVSQRLTKSAVARAKLVKSKVEEENAEKQHQEREKLRRQQQEKELAATLRADIAERENERKTKVTGYVELQGAGEKAAAAAAAARQDYRDRLRENRIKIAEKLKDRPSLIQRHEIDMRKKAAGTSALASVAKAVGGKKNELLSGEEKMRLGMTGDDDDDDSLGI